MKVSITYIFGVPGKLERETKTVETYSEALKFLSEFNSDSYVIIEVLIYHEA